MFQVTTEKLEKWKSKNNIKRIVKAMNNKEKTIRLEAIKIAGTMSNEELLNTLIVFLRNDPDAEVRSIVAEALGTMANARSQDHLAYVGENDADENVRKKAKDATKAIIARKMKTED